MRSIYLGCLKPLVKSYHDTDAMGQFYLGDLRLINLNKGRVSANYY